MNIQTLLTGFLTFLNKSVIPFLLGVAVLVFLWNIVRFFIIGGSNEESQEKARSQALWGILAFVIIVSFWGIVNFIVYGLGLSGNSAIRPDYMCQKLGGDCNAPIQIDSRTDGLYEAGALPQEI